MTNLLLFDNLKTVQGPRVQSPRSGEAIGQFGHGSAASLPGKCRRFSVPLESDGAGGGFWESQVVGFSCDANCADENWPSSHIFSPFLTSLMWDFLNRRDRRERGYDRQISERSKKRQIRGMGA